MAKYTIDDDTYTHAARFITKLFEAFLVSKYRIDLHIITGIIMVITLGFKHRIKVYNRYPQILEISKLAPYSLQVAAKEIICNDFLCIYILIVERHVIPISMYYCTMLFYKLIALTAETIREYLIHYGMLEPVWRFGTFIIHRDLER